MLASVRGLRKFRRHSFAVNMLCSVAASPRCVLRDLRDENIFAQGLRSNE
jgi:hypothetical protein